ncbi:MAG: cryptochrome/photolyase family protein [Bacteroidetes bacterium]|nr:cryptochrome/photolyase family protein [Bacteroidota bacterium]
MAVWCRLLDGTGAGALPPVRLCLLIMSNTNGAVRTLLFICPDQLNPDSIVLREADPGQDIVVMGESRAEATRFPFHIQRMALIFSAMRHRAETMRTAGFRVDYHHIRDDDPASLDDILRRAIERHAPDRIRMIRPNRFDLIEAFEQVANEAGIPLEYTEDTHFLTTPDAFKAWASGRKSLVMEHFYRAKRKETGYLMEGGDPAGGAWNFDADNRQSFSKNGPGLKAEPLRFEPDTITRKTILDLQTALPELPGSADSFGWPVTPEQAGEALALLGWREFIRGVYWLEGPAYGSRNALGATRDLPGFFWGDETDMVCVRQVVGQVLKHGYAHHIQRLMVTGLYALVSGTDPWAIHSWYMGLFVDAYDWVTLPNTVGMSQFADGGVVATKPYIASGQYVNRMSNYCASCRFNPKHASEDDACPMTTLYWSFLMEHEDRLAANRRMQFQVANLRRKSSEERQAILHRRDAWFDSLTT